LTTLALIGAGPGLGLATARRFGEAGYDIALISRNPQHQDNLRAELADHDVTARGFTADALDAASLTAALKEAAAVLGPIEVLQYSPVPPLDFVKPILDTGAADLEGPLAFSLKGPMSCVDAVLPRMRELGRGTLLFVNGCNAVHPHPDRAGTSIAVAAQSAYAAMLHQALAPANIHVAQLIVPGAIQYESEHSSPAALADRLYSMHRTRDGFRHYAEPDA
jgi:NAD(P)-dependent dehydrogenase (short-subunit alcohol dehydrogenase family)